MAKTLDKKKEREKKRALADRTKREALYSMPLQKENYLFIGIGFAVILIGYIIIGIERNVDGFLSLNVSPILIIGGFVWIIYAVLYKPKSNNNFTNTSSQSSNL
jgi:hypothetical protein